MELEGSKVFVITMSRKWNISLLCSYLNKNMNPKSATYNTGEWHNQQFQPTDFEEIYSVRFKHTYVQNSEVLTCNLWRK